MTDESNVQLHPGWRNALDLFEKADFPYGHVLTDEWLIEAFNLEPPPERGTKQDFDRWDLRFLQQFQRFARELADRLSLCLERVQGKGYRVLHPKAHARRALERLHRENLKASRRAVRTLGATRLQELSPAEKMEHANAMSLVARAKAAVPKPREWELPASESKSTPAITAKTRKLHEA